MRSPGGRVLLVQEDEDLRFATRRFLARRRFTVVEASGVGEAEERFDNASPEVVIVDYPLSDGDGLELLTRFHERDPDLAAIVLTGRATLELAVQAVKKGADQFLPKPVDMEALVLVTQRLCDNRSASGPTPRRPRQESGALDPFVGDSPQIRRLAEDASRVASVSLPVLIEGPTGSGKGVLARWIHEQGRRRDEAWVDLNCAGLSHQLLESELFGYERGAFTGAVAAKPGLLEVADQGTLFLDEVGDMGLEVQPRLLKVLEEKRFRRLGGVRGRDVDVRLIAATHHDLHQRARDGDFRLDLLYRIESVRLVMPALRHRGDDVLALGGKILDRLLSSSGGDPVELTQGGQEALREHRWPGNIRELRNVMERALLFAERNRLNGDDIQHAIANGRPAEIQAAADDESLEAAERRHIQVVLERFAGDVPAAAEALGISRSGLYKKLQRHGLSPRPAAPAAPPS